MRRTVSRIVVYSLGLLAAGGQAFADTEVAGQQDGAEVAASADAQNTAKNGEVDSQTNSTDKDKEKDKATHTVKAARGLNLRDKPTIKDSKILVTLPNGTPVKVLDKGKHPWWRASAMGQTGYLWYGYLKGGGKGADAGKDGKNGAKSGSKNGAQSGAKSGSSSGAGNNTAAGGGAPANGNAGTPGGAVSNTSNLSGLKPGFRAKVERILQRLQSNGWQPRVAEGLRTEAQQREKVRKGYSKTMNSYHLIGLAADIIDSRYAWNIPQSHKFWSDLGAAAAAENLTWGGNWKSFKDVAHVQARSRSDN